MKKALVIIGIVLIIFSTISIIDVTKGQSGAGLYGMLTGYLIALIISGTLIYFGTKETKKQRIYNNQTEKYKSNNQTLKELHEQGILTDDEYYEKSAKLKSEKLQTELKLTDEYKKLKSLLDDGILTKQEFDKKVDKMNLFSNGNNLSEKGKQRIKELVYEKINFKDYKEILNHFNKNDKINKALRDKLEKVLKIKTNLSDEKFIELIIKYLEEKFKT